MLSLPKNIEQKFREAGWYPGRDVQNSIDIPLNIFDFPEFVLDFLYEYGGLEIKGTTLVPAMLEIEAKSGGINAQEEDAEFRYYSNLLKKSFYPIGYESKDAFWLAVDTEGRVYYLGEYCFFRGKNISEGIINSLTSEWKNCLELNEDNGKWMNRQGKYVDFDAWTTE